MLTARHPDSLTMSTTLTWRQLPLFQDRGLPLLLAAIHTTASSYTVHMTDMANMWTESLDRKAICIRAWQENTSIDPSDTPENMVRFLSSLSYALDSSASGNEEKSITLQPGATAECGEGGLNMKLRCDLPGFEALVWPVYLKKMSSSGIASNLVAPLLLSQRRKDLEITSLQQALQQKDSVMVRLLDKLEATGTGLDQIFNPLAGKRKISREAAQPWVQGLRPFQRAEWEAQIEEKTEGKTDLQALRESILNGIGLLQPELLDFGDSSMLDSWWSDFKPVTENRQLDQTPVTTSGKINDSNPESMDVDQDGFEFESMPSPQRKGIASKSKKKTEGLEVDDASTAEDTDNDSMIHDSNPLRPNTKASTETKPKPQPTSRLGTIGGGSKQSTSAQVPNHNTALNHKAKAATNPSDDSETASEDESDAGAGSISTLPPKPSEPRVVGATKPPNAKVGQIGRIGGARKPAAAQEQDEAKPPPSAAAAEMSPSTKSPAKANKIGIISGGAKRPTPSTQTNLADRGRASSVRDGVKQDDEGKRRETSQERADRKRDEIKKELEKKAASGPVKKKRRF